MWVIISIEQSLCKQASPAQSQVFRSWQTRENNYQYIIQTWGSTKGKQEETVKLMTAG